MSLDAKTILYTFAAQDQLSPTARTIVSEMQALETETKRVNAEIKALGASSQSNVQSLTAHSQALTHVSSAAKDSGEAAKKAGAEAEQGFAQFGRGIASSVLNFSLLAGATVETGHIVGEFLTGSVEKAQALEEEIGAISALTPEMNVSPLFNQITALEVETGVLSQKLTAVFSIAAQAGGTGGNEQATLDLTQQLAQGAQANRQQDPTAWAKSALATMNAYGEKTQDVAHIQDVMTEALQKGAGQGQAFVQNLDRLTETSSQSHLSLEGLAAAFETVAQHGGDAEKNVTGLNSIIAAFQTDKAKSELDKLNISVTDGQGNVRDLGAIWTELATKLQGLSPSTQQSILTQIIPDKRSASEFQVLLSNMGQYNTLLKQAQQQAGVTSKQIDEFANSEDGAKAKLEAGKQSLQEQIGQLIDLEGWFVKTKQAADAYYATHPLGSPTTAPVKVGVSAVEDPGVIGRIIQSIYGGGGQETPVGLSGVVTGTSDRSRQVQEQQEVAEQTARASAAIKEETQAYQQQVSSVNAASQAAQTFVDWNGQVLSSSSSLTPMLAGVSGSINQLYQDSQRLAQGDTFGGFGSAQEQKIANIAEALKTADDELRAFRDTPVASMGLLGQLTDGTLLAHVKELQDQLKQASSQTPEAQAATTQFSQFAERQQDTQAVAQATQQLNDITDSYNGTLKTLQDEERTLQNELRDDSTPALAAARRELDSTTKALADTTQHYSDVLDDLNNQQYTQQQNEQKELDQPQRSLSSLQSTQQDNLAAQKATLDTLDNQLYQAEQNLTAAQNAETQSLAPLKTALDNATQATQALQEQQAGMDIVYQSAEQQVQRQIYVLQQLAYQKLTPLHQEIEKYQEQLYQLNQQEQAALRPTQDAIYGQTQALQGAQAAAQAVADKYANELNPLQAQYNALQREAQEAQNSDTLHKEAVSLDNLTARLANAKKGSAEYIELQQQIAQGKTTNERDTKMFGLQDRISQIQAEQQAAQQAAASEVERQQKILDALNEQESQITHNYDLQKRGTQDALNDDQHRYDQASQYYQDQESYYQNNLSQIQEAQTTYDNGMQDQINKAKSVQDVAQAAYDTEKRKQDALVGTAQAAVTAIQTQITSFQHAFTISNGQMQTSIDAAKRDVDQIKDKYEGPDGIITVIGKKITAEQHDATEAEKSLKKQADDAKTNYDNIRKEIQTTINKIGDQIVKTQDAATTAEATANRVINAEKAKQTALENTWAWLNAINIAEGAGGTIDPTKLPPNVKDPNAIPGLPVGGGSGDGSNTGGGPHKPAPPGQVGSKAVSEGTSVYANSDSVRVPVSAQTAGSARSNYAGGAGIGAVNINVILPQGMHANDKAGGRAIAENIFQGMQDVFGSKYGIRIVTEGV